jgi:nucleoside-diphosphate-sugar epimerase
MLLRPAIQGTENVLRSVNRTPSVKRVVITASTASVFTGELPVHQQAATVTVPAASNQQPISSQQQMALCPG